MHSCVWLTATGTLLGLGNCYSESSNTHRFFTCFAQELQYIEYFAGDAQCFKAVKNAKVRGCAVDIKYLVDGEYKKWNSFDLLTPPGLAYGTYEAMCFQCKICTRDSTRRLSRVVAAA